MLPNHHEGFSYAYQSLLTDSCIQLISIYVHKPRSTGLVDKRICPAATIQSAVEPVPHQVRFHCFFNTCNLFSHQTISKKSLYPNLPGGSTGCKNQNSRIPLSSGSSFFFLTLISSSRKASSSRPVATPARGTCADAEASPWPLEVSSQKLFDFFSNQIFWDVTGFGSKPNHA